MPLYLIPAEFSQFPDIAALSKAVADRGYDLSKHLVVKGVALRPVNRLELQPLDAVPKQKRDKEGDEADRKRVLDYVRGNTEPVTVAATAKATSMSTADVSRIKAALLKEKLLNPFAKKGTLAAMRTTDIAQ